MNETIVKSVIKKFNGDSVSPILMFRRLKGNHKYFFESSRQFQRSGEYSYMGVNPIKSFIGGDGYIEEINHSTKETIIHKGDPLELLHELIPNVSAQADFDFIGGLVGYVGYDSMLEMKAETENEIKLPLLQFDLYETSIIYSHITDEVYVIHNEIIRTYEEANVDDLIEQILHGDKAISKPFKFEEFSCHVTDEQFDERVSRAKLAIEQGKAVQLFLTKRYSALFQGDAFEMYRQLRKELLAPNMFYLEYPTFTLMGVSPESIIKIKGKKVFVSPITGARPRGATPREDIKMELNLLQNSREVNAHNILVDSTMADIETICMPGTVQLIEYMKPVQFKHSIRLTTEIEGILKERLYPIDALSLLIPPASSSGVPKRAAARIVTEIEETPREFSGGVLGYISLNRNINFTLLQQAMIIKDERAYIQAGANILNDSLEVDAHLEIRKKLKAFLNIE